MKKFFATRDPKSLRFRLWMILATAALQALVFVWDYRSAGSLFAAIGSAYLLLALCGALLAKAQGFPIIDGAFWMPMLASLVCLVAILPLFLLPERFLGEFGILWLFVAIMTIVASVVMIWTTKPKLDSPV